MKAVLIACWLLLLSVPLAAQTNPCTTTLPPGVILSATSEFQTTLTEHTAVVAGNPVVTEYEMGVFLPGQNPATGGQPVTRIPIPKARFTLVAGTTNCYEMIPTELLSTPVNSERYVAIRSRRTTPTVVEGAWGPLSNPFALLGALAAPSGARLTP